MIKEIIQGASVTWRATAAAAENYKPADGWVLRYYFRGAGAGLDIESTSESNEFILSLTSAQTAALAVGEYAYQAFAEKGGEKIFIAGGKFLVKQGFAEVSAAQAIDTRSEIKKILDAIDACLAKKATADQLSYTIGNRQLARYSMSDLILLRDKYQKLYNREKLVEKQRAGGGIFKTHFIRIKQ